MIGFLPLWETVNMNRSNYVIWINILRAVSIIIVHQLLFKRQCSFAFFWFLRGFLESNGAQQHPEERLQPTEQEVGS